MQEKIHPKHIIEDLKRQTKERRDAETDAPNMFDMFGDFNGLDPEAKTEFYQHDQHWQNRMILGDSLQVMASLAERENLRGKVQCIYFDPPYGIKFNSNWQVSTRSRVVKDGKLDQITREPEQVKAFRDTWKDGIHSYLTYLRDRLTAMRDLLTESGSIFVQIGDENVHRVRALMDEVFGEENSITEILVKKKGGQKGRFLDPVNDFILWYGKDKTITKSHQLYTAFDDDSEIARDFRLVDLGRASYSSIIKLGKERDKGSFYRVKPLQIQEDFTGAKLFKSENFTGGKPGKSQAQKFNFCGREFDPGLVKGLGWKHSTFVEDGILSGMQRLAIAGRVYIGRDQIGYVRYFNDFGMQPISNWWDGFGGASNPVYVVQTNTEIIKRCILLATSPGDLVLDPTCGSGSTAYAAEQWGRRWITIDTSRVALALTRTRLMSARFPYYLLADSEEGLEKESQISGALQSKQSILNDLRQGFVLERKNYITSTVIANNAEIDVIWEKWQEALEPLRKELNDILDKDWQEWEVPREADASWSDNIAAVHARWWEARIARQKEIDKSIAQKADVEYLHDRPYEDTSKVRVAGPFTVENLSPHRVISADDYELIDDLNALDGKRARTDAPAQDFAAMVLENLKSAGVHQSDKKDRINFTAMEGWPGEYIAATGIYEQNEQSKKAAIFIGPEFGSITRSDLMAAAREANDARFDVLIACGFNFDAHSSEVNKLGPLPILKAKMNPDLHMADDLKNTGAGNLFVVFGEPDVEWDFNEDGDIVVEVLGIDVFDPKTDEIRASGKNDIAAWFIDTDYNEESFFVRHAYFLGANDPYKQLKTSLKAEIDRQAWETLYRDTSRPFERPSTGRFAVKVINHFGDEVMKVFGV
ncbi:site-specific DNA-methyltransferase [Cohaesibacter gelatinilyticus]|uniref:site-specific DNA-methyltransferase n=1 Tax=Cohaesibacter gelatinilyticus TaxID=372072 RepID=UPI001FCE543E|nr:site-specific DNA-methyltransferase [Cohaesibacter gelatinilyticus]